MQKVTPFLWFNGDAEEALEYYAEAFADSKVVTVEHFSNGMNIGQLGILNIGGQDIYLFEGGSSAFSFNESVSLMVSCDDQSEIDYLWEKLSAVPEQEACGWCRDKFGVVWQIVPSNLADFHKSKGSMEAMMKMKKLDVEALEQAL